MNTSDRRSSAGTLKAKIVKIVFCLVFSLTVSGSFLTSPTWATPGVFIDSGPFISLDQTLQSVDVALGDVDGDGDLDALVPHLENTRLFLNDGSGVFSIVSINLGEDSSAVALGDVDGDRDLDAFIANNIGGNKVLLNDGSGLFTVISGLGSSDSRDVALGDVDGDGDLDAFIANFGQPNRVFLNDGAGNFTDSLQALGSSDSAGVELGDVDGDGDLDAFVVNQSGQGDQVYLNDGSGNFSDSLPALGSADSRDVALGDVDGDGDLDAFVVGVNITLYLNDGSGNFSDSLQALLGGSLGSLGVALGDVDGDGNLDAVVANFRDSNQVFLNDGSGNFSDSGQALGVDGQSFAVALGDVNGDGFLDAVFANFAEAEIVYLNEGDTQPTADAGLDQTVAQQGALTDVALNGSGSSDPNGDSLTFDWTGPFAGSPVTGEFPNVQLPPGTSVVTLVVSDATEDSDPDTAQITVEAATGPFESTIDITGGYVKLKSSKPNKDRFSVKGKITFSAVSDGIDLSTEDVTVVLGDFSQVIPAGSFTGGTRKFSFRGRSGGIRKMQIRDNGSFSISGTGLNLGGNDFTSPVPFSIIIGNDIGETTLNFNNKLRL